MVNTDYKIEAIDILLKEDCILKGYYPLIPYRDMLVERLKQMGCERKSDVQGLSDEALLQAGLPDTSMVALLRKFLMMYDPKPQKMRDIASVSKTQEETEAFKELYQLPGVKSTRARLYMRAGFATLADVAAVSPEGLIAACEQVIDKEQLALKAPLLKEARTHVAVAKALTDRVER